MSISRTYEFHVTTEEAKLLTDPLTRLVTALGSVAGSLGALVMENADDPTRLQLVEFWTSEAAHRASAASLPREVLEPLLAAIGALQSQPVITAWSVLHPAQFPKVTH